MLVIHYSSMHNDLQQKNVNYLKHQQQQHPRLATTTIALKQDNNNDFSVKTRQ